MGQNSNFGAFRAVNWLRQAAAHGHSLLRRERAYRVWRWVRTFCAFQANMGMAATRALTA